jgi:hypothetical protein
MLRMSQPIQNIPKTSIKQWLQILDWSWPYVTCDSKIPVKYGYSLLQFYLGILSARPYFSHYYSTAHWADCRPSHYYARHWLLTRSSEVVGGSEHVISYCAEEHGSRGVYLNKIEKDYRMSQSIKHKTFNLFFSTHMCKFYS